MVINSWNALIDLEYEEITHHFDSRACIRTQFSETYSGPAKISTGVSKAVGEKSPGNATWRLCLYEADLLPHSDLVGMNFGNCFAPS